MARQRGAIIRRGQTYSSNIEHPPENRNGRVVSQIDLKRNSGSISSSAK